MPSVDYNYTSLKEPNLNTRCCRPIGGVKLNANHPLAKDIKMFSFVTNGRFANVVHNGNIEPVPTLSGAIMRNGYLETGQTKQAVFDDVSFPAATQITIAIKARLDNENNTSNYIIGADNFQWLLTWINSDNKYQMNFNAGVNWGKTQTAFSLGVFNSVMAVLPGGSFVTNGYWIVNESQESPAAGDTLSTISAINTEIRIGDRSDLNRWFDGLVEYVAIWTRDLSPEEGISFQHDPYQIVIPVG